MRFYNRISRLQRHCNENCHAHYSPSAHSMVTNASISQGEGLYERLDHVHFPCYFYRFSPFTYNVCTCPIIHTIVCTLHVCKPTVWPVASLSLFLNIQVVTLLLENSPCLHVQISTTPLPGHAHIFQQYCMHAETNVHASFHSRICATLTFCYKLACVALLSIAN